MLFPYYPSTIHWPLAAPAHVAAIPQYTGGRPTPPSTPPPVRVARIADIHAPCPPTPRCVDDGWVLQDTSPRLIRNDTSPSEPYHATSFVDPPTAGRLNDSSDRTRDDNSNATSFANTLVTDRRNDSGDRTRCDNSAPDSDTTSDAVILATEQQNDSGDQTRYDEPVARSNSPHVSDCLIYSRDEYAHPSPIQVMIRRAIMDQNNLHTQPVIPMACDEPLKLFSLTGGRTPVTGRIGIDQQSYNYYAKRPLQTHQDSFVYPIRTIEIVQRSLLTKWPLVYPSPIPPVIIRSRDLVGPHDLHQRADGHAFVVPAEDSIWAIIRQRGVDLDHRPMDPSATVETNLYDMGAASYHPQHIVASDFAVNVFLEYPDFAAGPNPRCQYLGAYVMRVMDGLTINRTVWMELNPTIQQSVYNRVPACFAVYDHPSFGWPQLPYVQFCFYKWDENIIGLANENFNRQIRVGLGTAGPKRARSHGIPRREPKVASGYSNNLGSGFDRHCKCYDCRCIDAETAPTGSA